MLKFCHTYSQQYLRMTLEACPCVPVIYSLDPTFAAAGRTPVSASIHQGTLAGASLTDCEKLGFLFSKKALTPSFWSLCHVSIASTYKNRERTASQTCGK